MKIYSLSFKIQISDLLANENRAVTNLRKRLESGKVEDSDLANIDEHVQNILDSKIDNYVKSTYYKGAIFSFVVITQAV